MGTMTINLKDDVEKEFRETVKEEFGQGKGKLGKAIEDALEKWIHEKRQKELAKKGIELTNKGLYNLKGWKFNREEIYDRY